MLMVLTAMLFSSASGCTTSVDSGGNLGAESDDVSLWSSHHCVVASYMPENSEFGQIWYQE